MSIMGLRRIFSKSVGIRIGKFRLRLGSLMVIVLMGLALLFIFALIPGGPGRPTDRRGGEDPVREVTAVVAQVNGYKIERQEFERAFMRMAERQPGGMRLGDQTIAKYQLCDSMIERHLLLKAAETEGIEVSRQDLDARINELVENSINRRFPDQKLLRKYLKREGLSYDQYRKQLRDAFDADREPLREALRLEKLEANITAQVDITEEAVKQEYEEIKARHILIDPDKLAATPDSPEETDTGETEPAEEPAAEPSAEATRELAQKQAEELIAKLNEGADFADLAQEHSHDPSTAKRGGDLGWFPRRQMVEEFADAAFALQPGQVSGVVESPFGFHVIKVEDKRTSLPEDFEENKQRYMEQHKSIQEWQAWDEYKSNLRKQADIQIHDPELQAAALIRERKEHQAIPLLAQAAESDPYNLSARYTLATLYTQKGDKQQAVEYYRQVAEHPAGASSPELHLELGKLLRDQAKKEEALKEFADASDWAAAVQYGNNRIHTELKNIYEEMGRDEGVAQEQQWLDEFQAQQTESLGRTITLE